jgi:hypothetical protein
MSRCSRRVVPTFFFELRLVGFLGLFRIKIILKILLIPIHFNQKQLKFKINRYLLCKKISKKVKNNINFAAQ